MDSSSELPTPSDLTIRPRYGYGALRLGMTQDEVRGLLADPDEQIEETLDDGSVEESWEYEDLDCVLGFNSDDDGVLGSILVQNPDATLSGQRVVGLQESELLAAFESAGVTDLVIGADSEDGSARGYWSEEQCLMVMLYAGSVESITVLPRYDEAAEQPHWPPEDETAT